MPPVKNKYALFAKAFYGKSLDIFGQLVVTFE
jgi:hypothetical protein